jgi:hypothetical protein
VAGAADATASSGSAASGAAAKSHVQFAIPIPKLPTVFTGTGDLTAALLLAHSHECPGAFATACERALATVHAVCRRTMARYDAAAAALAAAGSSASDAVTWLAAAAKSSSGQMGTVVPVMGELALIASKGDIEHPPTAAHPAIRADSLERAAAAVAAMAADGGGGALVG